MDTSPTINSIHGRIRSITGTDPAADTEISETVPPRRRWRLLAIYYALVTDGNAANRVPYLQITDGTNTLFETFSPTAQIASTTSYYSLAHIGYVGTPAGGIHPISLPPLMLTAGYQIKTNTLNRQVGDNFSAPQLLVEEWIDP